MKGRRQNNVTLLTLRLINKAHMEDTDRDVRIVWRKQDVREGGHASGREKTN